VVIPKPVRDAAGLSAGTEPEIEPAAVPRRSAGSPGKVVIEADVEMPELSAEDLQGTLERIRR
jgi:bifunctional DNA-binding transcriptional regulator/antitoxin component of YhaV-PrlF toxin-antitoxin module